MPSSTSMVVRRRRVFLVVIAVVVVATLGFTFLGPKADQPTSASGPTTSVQGAGEGTAETGDQAVPEAPPAYLAWMSGGFPTDFRARIRPLDAFTATVVVAGDTSWLTRSSDTSGAVVDRPRRSFGIPIDAFAVNPVEYAPFLAEELRSGVIEALERGEGVLSTRSAELRRVGIGATLTFGDQDVRVGAIVPDEAIGWSELLVSRDVGERLGIVDDRYLLAFPVGNPSEVRFGEDVGSVLPEGTALRVEKPGGSPYMRVASGVNPPIVLKQVFGEFEARPDPRNPAELTIDPAWVEANIRTRAVPILGRVTCHVDFFPALTRALREVEDAGLASLLQTYDGCWNARTVARSPTAPPSFHAYGAAIDINAAANAFGADPTMDERVVEIFERHGFTWGGNFLVPDGMHFEYGRPAEDAA
jgi:D-alanyl-D-alanine carboxypeptidase